MEITEQQYRRIEPVLPRQRGNVSLSNLTVLNAILFVAEQGCKWRGLRKRFGNWHTIYTRMNRWAKSGVLDAVFEKLQREELIRIKIEAISMDSTIVKVHPAGTGAFKKRSGSGIWMDSRRAAQVQPPGAVGIRPRALSPPQRGRETLPQTQGIPPSLLSLGQARRHVSSFPPLRSHRGGPAIVLTLPNKSTPVTSSL